MSNDNQEKADILRDLGVLTVEEISERLGVHERTVYKWFAKSKPVSVELNDDKPWELTGDWCVAGDFHVDACDWKYVIEMMDECKRLNITKLVMAGDIFSFSKNSKHPKVFQEMSINEELIAARKLLALLFTHFTEIRWFIGNHDERLIMALEGEITIQDVGWAICPQNKQTQFFVSDSNFAWLNSGGVKWLLAHAYMYGAPLKVARELAHIHRCNVIQHHQHISAEGLSIDNKQIVVDNGCMCDSNKINYKSKRIQKFPEFNKGYTIIENGKHTRYYKVGA